MPVLTELTLYPIKSCAGIALHSATVTAAGLMHEHIYDREWMVVDADGMFLSQREFPRLALITPRLRSDTLELRAPGMLRLEIPLDLPNPEDAATLDVQVWDDRVKAYDCDELTATWFSQFLGLPCRLVRFHPEAQRADHSKWTGELAAPTLFADGYPMLVIGQAALDELNTRLRKQGRRDLPMNRFRPNLVIAGLDPHEEDLAASLRIGTTVLRPVKPCARCPIPSIDQATGIPGPDPLDVLQAYRTNPKLDNAICFGMNLALKEGEGALLKVGDQVEIELAF